MLFRLPHTFAETMLLLPSSATGSGGRALAGLGVTFLLGLGFVGMEISEFYGVPAAGAGPGRNGRLHAGRHARRSALDRRAGRRGRAARAEPIRCLPLNGLACGFSCTST